MKRLLAKFIRISVHAAFALLIVPQLAGLARAQSTIATLLAQSPALPDMALGDKNAPIKIIEYGSYVCGHCADFEQDILPTLRLKYINTGKVRYVFREWPFGGRMAPTAPLLARCVGRGDPEKYFTAAHDIFKQTRNFDGLEDDKALQLLRSIGEQNGISAADIQDCFTDQAAYGKLMNDFEIATKKLNVYSVPTLFINGKMIEAPKSFEALEAELKPLLKN